MNMKKEHQWLLLDSSGELSKRKQRRLQRALAGDPDLRRYAEELQQLTALERSATPEPPAFNSTVIEYQARRQQRAGVQKDFMTLWQPAIAYGAIAVALAMTVVYLSKNWDAPVQQIARQTIDEHVLAWEDPYLDALEDLNLQLAQLGNEPTTGGETDLDSLARELLLLGESS